MNRLLGCVVVFMLPGMALAADEAGTSPQQNITGLVLPIALFVLIFYFLMYRPQKKKQQQHDQMVSSIGRGDTVITAGGFFGKVWEVLDDSYIIELADGVKARILKSSISTRREVGDEKSKQPRKLKKKRRREKPEETDAALKDESSLKVLENGVSLEENDALIDLAAEGPRKETKASEKKENE